MKIILVCCVCGAVSILVSNSVGFDGFDNTEVAACEEYDKLIDAKCKDSNGLLKAECDWITQTAYERAQASIIEEAFMWEPNVDRCKWSRGGGSGNVVLLWFRYYYFKKDKDYASSVQTNKQKAKTSATCKFSDTALTNQKKTWTEQDTQSQNQKLWKTDYEQQTTLYVSVSRVLQFIERTKKIRSIFNFVKVGMELISVAIQIAGAICAGIDGAFSAVNGLAGMNSLGEKIATACSFLLKLGSVLLKFLSWKKVVKAKKKLTKFDKLLDQENKDYPKTDLVVGGFDAAAESTATAFAQHAALKTEEKVQMYGSGDTAVKLSSFSICGMIDAGFAIAQWVIDVAMAAIDHFHEKKKEEWSDFQGVDWYGKGYFLQKVFDTLVDLDAARWQKRAALRDLIKSIASVVFFILTPFLLFWMALVKGIFAICMCIWSFYDMYQDGKLFDLNYNMFHECLVGMKDASKLQVVKKKSIMAVKGEDNNNIGTSCNYDSPVANTIENRAAKATTMTDLRKKVTFVSGGNMKFSKTINEKEDAAQKKERYKELMSLATADISDRQGACTVEALRIIGEEKERVFWAKEKKEKEGKGKGENEVDIDNKQIVSSEKIEMLESNKQIETTNKQVENFESVVARNTNKFEALRTEGVQHRNLYNPDVETNGMGDSEEDAKLEADFEAERVKAIRIYNLNRDAGLKPGGKPLVREVLGLETDISSGKWLDVDDDKPRSDDNLIQSRWLDLVEENSEGRSSELLTQLKEIPKPSEVGSLQKYQEASQKIVDFIPDDDAFSLQSKATAFDPFGLNQFDEEGKTKESFTSKIAAFNG